MPPSLILETDSFRDACHWYWRLKDANGKLLGDHKVELDPSDWRYCAFLDLYGYLDVNAAPDRRAEDEASLVKEVGIWIGERVFGPLGRTILDAGTPATVGVVIPPEPEAASGLLHHPLELAYVDGKPLALHDISLIFEIEGENPRVGLQPVGERLRMLAVFSLPIDTNALNLRHERFELKRAVRSIAQRRGLAIDLRVLQYGVTRQALTAILREGEGWDIVHFSGHGLAANLILEKPDGSTDEVPSKELTNLLRPTRGRLKWVTLSACQSAAATAEETLRWLGLEPRREEGSTKTNADAAKDHDASELPAVARALIRELDCAVLAMRYPVGDEFAIDLGSALYEGVLDDHQTLPRALQLALPKTCDGVGRSPLSVATPALFGRRAADLELQAPTHDLDHARQPFASGLAHFPDPPKHFVGRVDVMSQASAALAPDSDRTGVLFHGMVGAGKTACAVELAHHFEDVERFTAFVWYEAPKEGQEMPGSLERFAQVWETQLCDEHMKAVFPLLHIVGAEQREFDGYLPRLRRFLESRSVLIVLDNMETLLRENGEWRDQRWGILIAELLSHSGNARVILTSRIRPLIPDRTSAGATAGSSGKATSDRLLELPIHALPLDQSALLARQLPNLSRLLRGESATDGHQREDHRKLVVRALRIVQGHPKLIDLAEGQAGDAKKLESHLDRASKAWAVGADRLDAFFKEGESKLGASDFLNGLAAWTGLVTTSLPVEARRLFHFLCCMEEQDRAGWIVGMVWPNLWKRLEYEGDPPDVAGTLRALASVGLVDVVSQVREVDEPTDTARSVRIDTYRIHPGVAQAGRAEAGDAFQAAVDIELAVFWCAVFQEGIKTETEGGGHLILRAGRSAAPYLVRQKQWRDAGTLLEEVRYRDPSPETAAAVLPMLRGIADQTRGSELELKTAGVLGGALLAAGRLQEGEAIMRTVIERATSDGEFQTASAAATQLVTVLRNSGRSEEALELFDRKKDYTRRADLGPWTQLLDEAQRLQLLNDLGRYEEVLSQVENLCQQMRTLPETSEHPESVAPWHVRELILSTGFAAAARRERWKEAVSLNQKIANSQEARGAPATEVARTRFNNYGPLLSLHRYRQVHELLCACRVTFETEGDTANLGRVFSAMANLESARGHGDRAVDHERAGLRYGYVVGNPAECAIGHFNLAILLMPAGGFAASSLAHRLACALIRLQTADGLLANTLRALSRHLASFAPDSPPLPGSFDELCERVEKVEGVRFRELFSRLPTTHAVTGDEALQNVLDLAKQIGKGPAG